MKINKNKLLKQFKANEEKLLSAIEEFQYFLDATEDEDLSSMGAELCELTIDFLHDNDSITLNGIREFIENEYE